MRLQVIWHLRMNREGRTCIARVTKAHQGTMVGVLVEAVRMREHLEVEQMSDLSLIREFPVDILHADEAGSNPPMALRAAAHQYLIHAAVAGATHAAVKILVQLCRPKQALRERIKANYTDKETS